MADDQSDTKVSYPYLAAGQWFGIRAKLRQSLPSTVDLDWIMAALGSSEKAARNILPQLKSLGVINAEGKPSTELVHDLRDDETYSSACRQILENVYPPQLTSAWDDPDGDPEKVAAWFMRNAGTGAATAKTQARLYLLLLKGNLPSLAETAKKSAAKRSAVAPPKKAAPKSTRPVTEDVNPADAQGEHREQPPKPPSPRGGHGPNLHIDMQIHISADASDSQIDTIFKSMAKHLYGRE